MHSYMFCPMAPRVLPTTSKMPPPRNVTTSLTCILLTTNHTMHHGFGADTIAVFWTVCNFAVESISNALPLGTVFAFCHPPKRRHCRLQTHPPRHRRQTRPLKSLHCHRQLHLRIHPPLRRPLQSQHCHLRMHQSSFYITRVYHYLHPAASGAGQETHGTIIGSHPLFWHLGI